MVPRLGLDSHSVHVMERPLVNISQNLKSLWIALLMFYGTAVAQSAYLSSNVGVGENESEKPICLESGPPSTKCSGTQRFQSYDQFIGFGGVASAEASYGPMTVKTYSAVYNYGALTEEQYWTDAYGNTIDVDTLYIYGLQDGEVAYLHSFFSLEGAAGTVDSDYYVNMYPPNDGSYTCNITGSSVPPNCSFNVPISYSEGQTVPINLTRNLGSGALSLLAAGAPNGAYVITGIQLLAYASFKVVDSKGHVIPGITVVGASGYQYE
jgi:hypothetical protein